MSLSYLHGLNIVVHPYLPREPKIELSPCCPVSQDFRKEFNAWLLERFGEKSHVIIIGSTCYVDPKTAILLRNLAL